MRLSKYRTTPEQKRRFYQLPTIRYLALVIVTGGAGLAGYSGWLWQDVIHKQLLDASADAGLRLERIEVNGRLNTSNDDLQKAIATDWHSPIFATDLSTIHDRVSKLGWVRAVRIERKLPSTLVVTIEERTALALFQDDSGHHVIDQSGAVIEGVAVEDFTHLPVIKGNNAPAQARSMIDTLKQESDLYTQVWSLVYQSNRRWDVYLRNNIRVQLPEADPGNAWSRLAEMDRERQLTRSNITNIDLRIPEKLVIRSSPAGQKGNNT